MADRVYGDASLPKVERNAATLAKAILEKGQSLKRLNASDVRRYWRLPSLRYAKDVDAAFAELAGRQWFKPDPSREGVTKGRQTKDFEINHRLWRVAKRVLLRQ